MNRALRTLALLLLSACGLACFAQAYPSKPIELVVHTSPGSGSDLVARTVADIITRGKFLPQPLVVQNRGGGGGTVAQTYVAGKRGDPYVIMATTATVILSVPIRTGLDVGLDKFHPLGLVGIDLNTIGVRDDSAHRTLKDFIAAGRANPKSITVAIGSVGGTGHHFV